MSEHTHLMEEDWWVDGVHEWCMMNWVHNWWGMYSMDGMHGWNGADNWDLMDWCRVHNTPMGFETRRNREMIEIKKKEKEKLWHRY